VNDDSLPAFSIGNATVAEGNAGTAAATFTVTLSAAAAVTTSVQYATADGTAAAGSDYAAAAGTLSFAPGTTSQVVSIVVNGDVQYEPDETFVVNLSGADNAAIAAGVGTGTIVNDDVAALPWATCPLRGNRQASTQPRRDTWCRVRHHE
jgi:hypothetical protein